MIIFGYPLRDWLVAFAGALLALAFGIVYVDLLILVLGGM